MPIGRRSLLLSALALIGAACARSSAARPTPAAIALPPEFDRWNQEAQGILSDVLQTLRTFDTFQAFRVSTAPQSSMRLSSELIWDSPTSAAWDEATHVTVGLHGRAEQLFNSITSARSDPNLWREQRSRGDASHGLLDLSDALVAYRNRVGVLPPGDASAALPLLDKAWSQFDSVAADWAITRGEQIGCASP